MKIITYIAVIEHMSGMDIHTAASEEALAVKVADYCRSHWDTIPWKGEAPPDIPETDAAVIERYFDDHENDSLTTAVDSVEIGVHLVVEVFDKKPTVSMHPSAEAAASCALDIAMENFWDRDTDEAAARAEFERKLDEEDCVCSDSHEVHLLPELT
jgi:hypothetical protein